MKRLISCITFFCLLAVISCNDDKEEDLQAKLFNFSIEIKGKLMNGDVSFKATGNSNIGMGIETPNGCKYWINDNSVRLNLPSQYKGGWGLKVQLLPLASRLYAIQGDSFPLDSSMVSFEHQDYSANLTTYFPLKKPLKVTITRYERPKDVICPIIEGTMEGTVYNINNPHDSIEVKDFTFDIH